MTSADDDNDKLEKQICRKIRSIRTVKGVKQEVLAELIHITRQQMQLHETGARKVSAGKLYRVAKSLDVTVETFFPDGGGASLEKLSDDEIHLVVSFRKNGKSPQAQDGIIRINEIISQIVKGVKDA